MTPKEQEIAIGELEERVDRLRNLYEQYFLGFEKLEPSVSRKDVDRRFMILRKEQIRNTAMRFRFNVVTQKYNTYAMHWVRICRQIEDGTYKRHIRKAKARFGDVARVGAEKDVSIDIDIGDFETEDVDALLAEANAAAETFARDAGDTIPPAAAQSLVRDKAAMQARARELLLATPGTSFAIGGSREVLDDMDSAPPSGSFRDRAARGAALPPGAKPRILRKRDDTDPPSGKTLPGGPPSSPSLPHAHAAPPASSPHLRISGRGSSPDLGPASSRMASSPNLPGGAQSRPRIAPVGTNATAKAAQSAGQIPASARSVGQSGGRIDPSIPTSSTPSAGAPAAGRIPVAQPAQPAPPAPPAAQSSAGRIPVPAAPAPPPGQGAPSGLRPPPAMPSAGRRPVPAPLPPPSDRRLPAAPPAAPSAPGMRSPGGAPPPAPFRPSVPGKAAPPAGPPGPRAPMQSVSDAGPPSDARQSVRPRAPLPLPSQSARPKKE